MRKSKIIWFVLAGMLLGYLLVHPFAMLANMLGPRLPHVPMKFPFWGHSLQVSFGPEMLPMSLAFAFMGGLTGFCLGIWYHQRLESHHRQVALETLQELMVTLAHHIRNANMIIGGFSNRLIKLAPEPEAQRQLEMIQQASRKIEAVIDSLENLKKIEYTQYIDSWETRMINLKKELESRLKAVAMPKETQDGRNEQS